MPRKKKLTPQEKLALLELKQQANWQCQNSECRRNCIRPGEEFADFMKRIGNEYWLDLEQDCERNPESRSVRVQAFRLVVIEGQVLCAPCAMLLMRQPKYTSKRTKYAQRELRGQGRLDLSQ